ncbi:hypothetical protein ACO2Q8_12080 [Larkinella sp. VNQ87]|uniref:hypothetical protein n=1 Tax=Larkinella sp. VNQ87 TaxID=3400921 RepID=UPI003C0C460A
MPRKIRSDIKIGNLEKKLGLNKGAIRNPDGTDARSDKKLGTLREEYKRQFAGPPVRTNSNPIPSGQKKSTEKANKENSNKKSTSTRKKSK